MREGCQLEDGPYCLIQDRDVQTLGLPDYNNTEREPDDEDEDLVTNVIG